MFLAGLVHNANRLMYELRKIGERIQELNQLVKDLEEQGASTRIVRNQIDCLYRQSEDVSVEWSAEVQYVHAAIALLEGQPEAPTTSDPYRPPILLSGEAPQSLAIRLESKPDFVLLQRIAEGSELLPGFRPNHAAISDHREFLNHILARNGIEPFLLHLDGKLRDQAARLLGETIIACVPEHRLHDLESGTASLSEFDSLVSGLATEMATQVKQTQRIDFSTLFGLKGVNHSDASVLKDRETREVSVT